MPLRGTLQLSGREGGQRTCPGAGCQAPVLNTLSFGTPGGVRELQLIQSCPPPPAVSQLLSVFSDGAGSLAMSQVMREAMRPRCHYGLI